MQKLWTETIWPAWKRFGQLMGDIVGRVVLTIFYFTIFLPFGLVSRLGRDPLTIQDFKNNVIGWIERTGEEDSENTQADKLLQRAKRLG
ncbi:MAG: hypothetical protein AAF639_08245 [Chloroflexota bacterium]